MGSGNFDRSVLNEGRGRGAGEAKRKCTEQIVVINRRKRGCSPRGLGTGPQRTGGRFSVFPRFFSVLGLCRVIVFGIFSQDRPPCVLRALPNP